MTARNGPGDDDRRLPEGERRIGERLGGQLKSSATTEAEPSRRTDVVRVWARADQVLGQRGAVWTAITVRCAYCSGRHAHVAPAGFVSGVRRAACGAGTYLVLTDGVIA